MKRLWVAFVVGSVLGRPSDTIDPDEFDIAAPEWYSNWLSRMSVTDSFLTCKIVARVQQKIEIFVLA